MLTETTAQLVGNDRYEGFGIDVIQELSKLLGFNYTFVEQEDGSYGVLNKTTGIWDGMMGEIIAGVNIILLILVASNRVPLR